MRRLITVTITLVLCTFANAQYYVYETTGDVYIKVDNNWKMAYKTMSVKPSNLIRTDKYASVVILDRSKDKLYALQSTTPTSLESLILGQKSSSNSLLREVSQALYSVLFEGKSMSSFENTSGVSYRSEDDDRKIAQALATSKSNSNKLFFRILGDTNNEPLTNIRARDYLGVVEITNNSAQNLYVNIAVFDSTGKVAAIFPSNGHETMTDLYIPAFSVVRLSEKIEFVEPYGEDRLVLVAYHKPFNLENVLKLLPTVTPQASEDIHTATYTITTHK